MIFRCFETTNYRFILKWYISYARPILEYKSSIWNPHGIYIGNSNLIEKVQRYFTKQLLYRCNLITCNYTGRLIFMKLKSLSYRRLYVDIILGYTIIYGLVDVDRVHYLDCYDSKLRGLSIKIRGSHGKTNALNNIFVNIISMEWNKLPRHVSDCGSLHLFGSKIDKYVM